MKIFRFVLELFKRYPFWFSGNISLLVVVNIVGALAIFSIAPVIDSFIGQGPTQQNAATEIISSLVGHLGLPNTLICFLGFFLAIQTAKNGLTISSKYLLLRLKYVVNRDVIVETFEDFFNARWIFFSNSKQGTIINTFLHETRVGEAFGAMTLLAANCLQMLFYIAVPFYISWQVTTISLIVAVVFVLPFTMLREPNYRLGKLNTSTGNELSGIIQESLASAKIILGFGNQTKTVKHLKETFDIHVSTTLKSQTLRTATPLIYEPFGLLVVVIALLSARNYNISLSDVAVMLWALQNAIPLLGGVVAERNAFANFAPSFEQIKALRHQAQKFRQFSGDRPFQKFEQGITLNSVGFSYPTFESALVGVNMDIPKGTMIALVGESGAGKSTLIDLIMGFHEPQEGRILCDGIPLGEYDINSYRRRIGYVPQDSILFNRTIADNLRWSKEDATDEEIVEACRQANADDFIRGFPQGYETWVGDRGVRLSGGQCQRIALARAILRKPELLVLDEATSALDTQSERLIQKAIESIARQTTIIAIAHRLSTIVNADYVYVMHKGRVVEEGSYRSLISLNGRFKQMTQLQLLQIS